MNSLSRWMFGVIVSSCSCFANADTPEPQRWFDDLEGTLYLGIGKGYHHTLVPGLDQEQDINQGLLFVVTGELTWGNFFIETPMHRQGAHVYSASVGYRFYQQQQHSWDLLSSNYNVWIPDNKISSATPQLTGLQIRNSDTLNSLRYQYQVKQHLIGVEAGFDLVSHHGAIGRMSYSYLLPWRNLDLYLNAALTFEPAKVVNYYYGVAPEEATPERPIYRAGAGIKTHFGISAIYPLAEHWQLDGSVGVNLFSRNYLDSPLVNRSHEQVTILMVRYVF